MRPGPLKALEFVGTSLTELRAFPEPARRAAGFNLWQVQRGIAPEDCRPMPQVGPGVLELRIRALGQWRVMYVAKFEDAVYVLHAFQKKTRLTARRDIELARKRYRHIGR
jgi:phage-related protein